MSRFARTLAACAFIAAWPLQAEPSKFTPANLTVVPAARFVNESNGIAYLANQELVLTRRPNAPRQSAEMTVRIFTLSPGQTTPGTWAVFEPCWVYFSVLAPVYVNPNGTVKIGSLSRYWLQVSPAGQMTSGHYLLVFEVGRGDDHQLIRINQTQPDDYFRHGLIIEVRPERPYARQEIADLERERAADAANIRAAARVNESRWRCYVARPPATAASDEADPDVHYAMTDNCDEAIDLP